MDGRTAVLRVDLDTGPVSAVAAGLLQPVPTPVGDLLAAADSEAGALVVLALDGRERWRAALPGGAYSTVHWSPDGNFVAVTRRNPDATGRVTVVSAADGSLVWEGDGHALGWETGTGRLPMYQGTLEPAC
ncbi:MAG: hypothetical protein FWJ62_09705 [Thermaerobacter sp.]